MKYCFIKDNISSRLCGWSIFLLLSLALIMTASRSAMLALAVGLLIRKTLVFSKKERRAFGLSALSVGIPSVLMFAAMYYYFDISLLADLLAQKSDSSGFRVQAFSLFTSIILDNPFFGLGYQNVWVEAERLVGFPMGAHNIFMGVLIDFGIFAFLIFTRLIWGAFANIRSKLKSGTIEDVFAHTFLSMIIGLVIHGQFHEIQVNLVFWLILLLAISFPAPVTTQSRETNINYYKPEPL